MKNFSNQFYILVAALSLSFSALGQAVKVSGTLTDAAGSPLEIANVLLLNEAGELVTGEFVYDGAYAFNAPASGNYELRFTAIGYTDGGMPLVIPAGVNSHEIPTFSIETAGINMATVEVTALRKPFFENQGGKLIVNVAESQLAAGSTVQELLSKTPTVQAGEEGGVSVFGKGKAIVLLDGRRVTGDELSSLPAEDIEKIEVIANPSARYEATGRAVINVISKKNRRQGAFLNFLSAQKIGRHWRTSNGGQASFRNEKINLDGAYYYHPYKKEYTDEYERDQGDVFLSQRIDRLRDRYRMHTYRVLLDYNIGPESGVGLQYRGNVLGDRTQVNNVNQITGAGDLTGILNTSNGQQNNARNSLTLNYWKNFGDEGRKLVFFADVTNYDGNASEKFDERFQLRNGAEERRLRTSTTANAITISTAQVDYELPVHEKKGLLTTGLRGTSINSKSSLLFEEMVGNEMVEDDNLSNEYAYLESIGAAYVDYEDAFGKLKVNAGLRAEHTLANGESRAADGVVIERDYLSLFPSVGVAYPLAEQLEMSLKYGKRIERPSFQDMDPFLVYIDSLSYSQGNPALRPAFVSSLDYSLTYRQFASFNIGYQVVNDALFQFVEPIPGQEGGARLSMRNLDQVRTFSLGLTLPYQTKKWTTVNNFGMKWNEVAITLDGEQVEFNRPLWYAAFYNSLKIGKGFAVEATVQYNSSGQQGIFTFNPMLKTNVAISKKLLDDKLTLTLSANDLFDIERQGTRLNIAGLNVTTESFYDAHWIQFVARYRIGVSKNSRVDRSIGSENLNRIK